jgi:hypothetical protein
MRTGGSVSILKSTMCKMAEVWQQVEKREVTKVKNLAIFIKQIPGASCHIIVDQGSVVMTKDGGVCLWRHNLLASGLQKVSTCSSEEGSNVSFLFKDHHCRQEACL